MNTRVVKRSEGSPWADAPIGRGELTGRPRVLLSTVFAPFGDVPVTVLEYPTREAFVRELEQGYDYVGVSFVGSTLGKARAMCELVRQHSPRSETVVGGGGTLAIAHENTGGEAPFSDHVCRGDGVAFMRELLGLPPQAPRFPIVPSVHRPNTLLGLPAHDPNFAVAVGLGCRRACEFCATSHQFGGRYLPLFESGEQLFAWMKAVEEHERARGREHSAINFLVFDENFLMNRALVEEFRRLNREQLLRGPAYHLFVFADAGVLSGYTAEELLEAGVDSVWVGLESPTNPKFRKLDGVDGAAIVRDLAGSVIKVFVSLIAGLEDHTEESIRADMEAVLALPTTSVQYAPADPIPGTPYHSRLAAAGMLPERDLTWFSMSHDNVAHPTLDEPTVLGLIDEFLDRDHARNGPLVYRFLAGRWRGWLGLRDAPSPYLRARAEVFRRDVMRGMPVIVLGERFAPSAETRARFTALREAVQAELGWWAVAREVARGSLGPRDGGLYLLSSPPLLRTLARGLLSLNVLLRDPRLRWWEPLLRPREAVRTAGAGMVPWGQPVAVRTVYG